MRDPNLGTVNYTPGDPGNITMVQALLRFVRDELLKIAAALDALAGGHLDKVYIAPVKPRDGDLRYADGTNWNPGGGQGIYYYDAIGATWVQLG